MHLATEEVEIRHFHLFCGLGGAARGFNRGRAQLGNMRARFRCLGGVDVDAACVRDFSRLAGVRGTLLDLFDREQYRDFHGGPPPADWREAGPDDIRCAAGGERPNIVFLSAPCKGFSGLLSESKSLSAKYQALNRLTLRGIWLMLEAWADDPPELVIFENVPRIATRGRHLLDQIGSLLRHYGYAVAETTHDCGEIGGLAQSRRRFLLVARHIEKVPAFVYEPPRRPLRAVGDILGRMPMPDDPRGGPMHLLPNLQWKTWVRLAFVEAGSDWRSLNKLRVVDGKLADYLIVPEAFNKVLGVTPWDCPAGTITGNARSVTGSFSVADPRQEAFQRGYGVCDWQAYARAIQGRSAPSNGEFAVADPRFKGAEFCQFGVRQWNQPTGTVTSQRSPGQGTFAIADPRMPDAAARQNGIYRVVRWDSASGAITGASHVAGAALSVADPRAAGVYAGGGKYRVTPFEAAANTVIAESTTGHGAYAVADPRPPNGRDPFGKYAVTEWEGSAGTVIGGDDSGAYTVADPRLGIQREPGDDYVTAGHYGVVLWDSACGAVSAAAQHDNGRWSVADPRIPLAGEKTIAVIRALDGTWHRPFTTLELAALQSLVDPDDYLDLDGNSDGAKRERIGNAVPPRAAQAIADLMGETLLAAWSDETFRLSDTPVWVRPVAVALSVRTP